MFDTVILLTGPSEHSVFTTLLRGHRPALTIIPVFTLEDLTAIEPEWLQRARLISFITPVIVPGAVLSQLGYGAYNFHPGSPQFPGRAPARAAVSDGAREFGCTVHRMIERVSAGPIVEVERFPIPPGTGVSALEELAYTRLVAMFWRMAGVLASQHTPLIERALRWSPKADTRVAMPEAFISAPPLPRRGLVPRIRESANDHFGIVPRLGLPDHGLRVVAASTAGRAVSEPADS